MQPGFTVSQDDLPFQPVTLKITSREALKNLHLALLYAQRHALVGSAPQHGGTVFASALEKYAIKEDKK